MLRVVTKIRILEPELIISVSVVGEHIEILNSNRTITAYYPERVSKEILLPDENEASTRRYRIIDEPIVYTFKYF